ncbi:hypothetical protein AAE478_007243 [Parahypoxylon ruwenzoriense]
MTGKNPTSPFFRTRGQFLRGRAAHLLALGLLAVAFALVLIVDCTAPANHGLALFTAWNEYVHINEGYPIARFGTFGYCLQIISDLSSSSRWVVLCITIRYYPIIFLVITIRYYPIIFLVA